MGEKSLRTTPRQSAPALAAVLQHSKWILLASVLILYHLWWFRVLSGHCPSCVRQRRFAAQPFENETRMHGSLLSSMQLSRTEMCHLLQPSVVSTTFVLGSARYKFGYVRVGKCASKEITKVLEDHYPDIIRHEFHNIPDDWFLFTIVRDPLKLAIHGYAEIEEFVSKNPGRALRLGLSYFNKPKSDPTRFPTFLDQLFEGRFGFNSRENFFPGHAYPLATKLRGGWHRLDFVGMLEQIDHDFQLLKQRAPAASMPQSFKDLPSLLPPRDRSKPTKAKLKDQVTLDQEALCRIVVYYAVDYACFGFPEPIPLQNCSSNAYVPWLSPRLPPGAVPPA